MAPTLEDLDRRVTALEKATRSDDAVVRAVAEIVADSEKRTKAGVEPSTTGSAPPSAASSTSSTTASTP